MGPHSSISQTFCFLLYSLRKGENGIKSDPFIPARGLTLTRYRRLTKVGVGV